MIRRSIALIFLAACAAPLSVDDAFLDDAALESLDPVDYHPDTVLVGTWDGGRVRFQRDTLVELRHFGPLSASEIEVPPGIDAITLVRELRQSGEYRWVEPNLVRRALTVNDPGYPYQWNFTSIDVEGAWSGGTGSGAVAAVIDSGVSAAGSDSPNITGGYDFVDGDTDATDLLGHGTHVAGTIAQATDNGIGVAGIAHDASIMPVRVLDAWGYGYTADIVDGIIWAADNGADVANMSLGSSYGSATEQAAVAYADSVGMFIAGAAGNSGRWGIDYPARYAEVMAVGATDISDTRTYYSDRGPQLEVMAPGGDMRFDLDGDGYADGIVQETFSGATWGYEYYEGTSMSTAHVTGVAALLAGLGASSSDIRSTLQSTAIDMDVAGFDPITGYGLLDAGAAVAAWGGTPGDGDGDGWTTADGDCDDSDASVHPGATEVCEDGIDNDCDGVDDTCSSGDITPPVISRVWARQRGASAVVRFMTDEDATGLVCDDLGNCATTALDTRHTTGWFGAPGTTYTIIATDAAGNSSTYGPAAF